MLAKLTPPAAQENSTRIQVTLREEIIEFVLIYNSSESKSFPSLECKVCCNGKVENECFKGFHAISYVN